MKSKAKQTTTKQATAKIKANQGFKDTIKNRLRSARALVNDKA